MIAVAAAKTIKLAAKTTLGGATIHRTAAFDTALLLDRPQAADQACDHMCAIMRELARTAGVEPTPPEWRSGTLPLSHVREG